MYVAVNIFHHENHRCVRRCLRLEIIPTLRDVFVKITLTMGEQVTLRLRTFFDIFTGDVSYAWALLYGEEIRNYRLFSTLRNGVGNSNLS